MATRGVLAGRPALCLCACNLLVSVLAAQVFPTPVTAVPNATCTAGIVP